MKNGKNREACLDEGRIFLGFHMVRSSIGMQRKWNREEVLNSWCLFICVNVRASAVHNFFFRLGGWNQYEKSDNLFKIQNCTYFSKNKKIRKKVLTFALGGVIITKLSARATAHEFFWNRKTSVRSRVTAAGCKNCFKKTWKKFLTKANEFDKINELLIERTAEDKTFSGSSKELQKIN